MELRITNMTMSGRLPLKKVMREKEVARLIEKGFELVNEEISPMLMIRFPKEGISLRNRRKCACVSIWTSGAFNIVGITSEEEGLRYYKEVLEILNKEVKRIFQ